MECFRYVKQTTVTIVNKLRTEADERSFAAPKTSAHFNGSAECTVSVWICAYRMKTDRTPIRQTLYIEGVLKLKTAKPTEPLQDHCNPLRGLLRVLPSVKLNRVHRPIALY